jgi:hypothetical protein
MNDLLLYKDFNKYIIPLCRPMPRTLSVPFLLFCSNNIFMHFSHISYMISP